MITIFGIGPHVSPKLALGLLAGGLGLLGLGYLGYSAIPGPRDHRGEELHPRMIVKGIPSELGFRYDLLEVCDRGVITSDPILLLPESDEPRGYALRCRRCDWTGTLLYPALVSGALVLDTAGQTTRHQNDCVVR